MNKKMKASLFAGLFLASSMVLAQQMSKEERAVSEALRGALSAADLPIAKPSGVKKMSNGVMYEVLLEDGNVVYTDKKVTHLFIGNVLDLKTRENITQKSIDEYKKVKWSDLPLENAIKVTKGKGEYKMAVFSDPNCPHCKRLEREMEQLTNATIYIFMVPILSADSRVRSQSVWCAPNKAKAWEQLMLESRVPDRQECPNPLDKNLALAKQLDFSGTPSIYFPNTKKIVGATDSSTLEKALKENQK